MSTAPVRSRSGRRVAAVVAVMLALVVPASAQADGAGPLTLEGEASLPQFPCPLPDPGEPACSGTFEGTVSGELGGQHLGNAWSVALADAPITATFTYADGNCARGTASGTATISGGPDHVAGTYDRGGPLPRLITAVTITADFEWARDGVTALVVPITDAEVVVDLVEDGPRTVMAGGVGGGEAVFTPHIDPDDQPDCLGGTNTPAITADVAGSLAISNSP